jgi:hypothetical protein
LLPFCSLTFEVGSLQLLWVRWALSARWQWQRLALILGIIIVVVHVQGEKLMNE